MLNIGIIGAGHIAASFAKTIHAMNANGENEYCLYAIASRTLSKAEDFAKQYQVTKAFGSYEEMLEDKDLDLVYIATPHSLHYPHALLCLKHHKHVLCEKAFTVNAEQAQHLFAYAKEQNCMLTEALKTAYMPFLNRVKEEMESGKIGEVRSVMTNFCHSNMHKANILDPDTAGGALLDLAIYPLCVCQYLLGTPDTIHATAQFCPTGVDISDQITMTYKNGIRAQIVSAIDCRSDKHLIIAGSTGYMIIDNCNNPERIRIYNNSDQLIEEIKRTEWLTGFEFEIRESKNAIDNHQLETASMPHRTTLALMTQMDEIRRQIHLKYPEKIESLLAGF